MSAGYGRVRGVRCSVPAAVMGIVLMVFTGGVSGCRLDYDQAVLPDELSEDTPETILIQSTITLVRSDSSYIVVQSGVAENYPARSLQVLSDVQFAEFAADGAETSRGSARSARVRTDTDNVELTGSVYLYSVEHEASVRTEYLYWDNAEGRLAGNDHEPVTVENADGTVITGTGFSADTNLNQLEFSGGVRGVLIVDQEDAP
jgi:LPS export ABC transporter protein LptC